MVAFALGSACGLSVVGTAATSTQVEGGADGGAEGNIQAEACGDGIVQPPETCDLGLNDGRYGGCNADCTKAPFCGDGVVNGDEPCDLGAANSAVGSCSTTCATTSLLLWLDASDPNGTGGATVVADGTAFNGWIDKARGRSVIQTSSSRQPRWRSAAISGRPAFEFDGVDDLFDVDLDINGSVLPQLTIVVVFQNTAGGTASFAGLWGHDDGNWDRFMGTGGTMNQNGISNGTGFTPVTGLTTTDVPLVVTTTLRADTPNLSTVHVNGGLAATFTGSIRPGTSRMSLGNIYGPSLAATTHAFDGHVAALRVYGEALTDADRVSLEAELMKTYVPAM